MEEWDERAKKGFFQHSLVKFLPESINEIIAVVEENSAEKTVVLWATHRPILELGAGKGRWTRIVDPDVVVDVSAEALKSNPCETKHVMAAEIILKSRVFETVFCANFMSGLKNADNLLVLISQACKQFICVEPRSVVVPSGMRLVYKKKLPIFFLIYGSIALWKLFRSESLLKFFAPVFAFMDKLGLYSTYHVSVYEVV
jgi:hypothetical protein